MQSLSLHGIPNHNPTLPTFNKDSLQALSSTNHLHLIKAEQTEYVKQMFVNPI